MLNAFSNTLETGSIITTEFASLTAMFLHKFFKWRSSFAVLSFQAGTYSCQKTFKSHDYFQVMLYCVCVVYLGKWGYQHTLFLLLHIDKRKKTKQHNTLKCKLIPSASQVLCHSFPYTIYSRLFCQKVGPKTNNSCSIHGLYLFSRISQLTYVYD